MKKILLLFGLILFVVSIASAQVAKDLDFGSAATSKSLTNAATGNGATPVDKFGDKNRTLMIQLTATQSSGTTAGQAWLQQSIDGTTWKTLNATNCPTMTFTTNDTLTLVNGATQIWTLSTVPAYQYRVYMNQTGNSVTVYTGKYLFKKN